jgi:hypothetical protein
MEDCHMLIDDVGEKFSAVPRRPCASFYAVRLFFFFFFFCMSILLVLWTLRRSSIASVGV